METLDRESTHSKASGTTTKVYNICSQKYNIGLYLSHLFGGEKKSWAKIYLHKNKLRKWCANNRLNIVANLIFRKQTCLWTLPRPHFLSEPYHSRKTNWCISWVANHDIWIVLSLPWRITETDNECDQWSEILKTLVISRPDKGKS